MHEAEDDKAPLFKSWKGWYMLVLALLVAEILLLTYFTRYFS
ncbi:MAG: hypothetical protein SFU20_06800 [Chitinophagaceae bacterium]|nr:hypothetical protein [Chitinophagaceae bacterium]